MIVNKNGVFIDTHVRYRTISDNLSKQEYKFLLTTTLTISAMTIRIDRALQEEYNDLAAKTNRSRNELISMALQYALDHMELKDE